VLTAYASVFLLSISTFALIEIRRANLKDFDSLIAILEQQERYFVHKRFEQVLTGLAKDIDEYQKFDSSLPCPPKAGGETNPVAAQLTSVSDASHPGTTPPSKSCADVKTDRDQHLYELLSLQSDLAFQKARLPKYYDEYTDGLRDKAPQLIPLLRYVASTHEFITAWARLPLELLEMILLVCMGALGGIIAVTRCFIDATPNPRARDLCYRPVTGAVIALGIYVLFRAMQLFFGGGSQDSAGMVSTSVFLLAALGLASGFCAREAVTYIETAATRILRSAENDSAGNSSAGGQRGVTSPG
jgi:hypothetical protein